VNETGRVPIGLKTIYDEYEYEFDDHGDYVVSRIDTNRTFEYLDNPLYIDIRPRSHNTS